MLFTTAFYHLIPKQVEIIQFVLLKVWVGVFNVEISSRLGFLMALCWLVIYLCVKEYEDYSRLANHTLLDTMYKNMQTTTTDFQRTALDPRYRDFRKKGSDCTNFFYLVFQELHLSILVSVICGCGSCNRRVRLVSKGRMGFYGTEKMAFQNNLLQLKSLFSIVNKKLIIFPYLSMRKVQRRKYFNPLLFLEVY